MDFDLRTCDTAYYFVLEFMNMTPDEYLTELVIECENDFEKFWKRNIGRITEVNIEDLYNIEQLKYIPEKADEERTAEAEKFFIKGEYETAYHMFKKLAEEGVPRAMYFMGEYLRQGYGYYFGLDYDEEEGFRWHQKGAELGDPLCILNTAYMYEGEERERIKNSVTNKLRKMSQSGDAFVKSELADIVDGEEKIDLLKEASEQGLARGWYKLGMEYNSGNIVKKDDSKVLELLLKASELGSADAMGSVGVMYEYAVGADKDINKAIEYYNKSIKRGCGF